MKNSYYLIIAALLIATAVVLAGCTTQNPGSNSAGSGGPGTGGAGSGVGGSSGGFGPVSKSVGTGPETWQATVSLSRTDQVSSAMSRQDDPQSTKKESSSSTWEFHGSFPVTVEHSISSADGKTDIYQTGEPDRNYPVAGSYQSHDHVESHGTLTDMATSGEWPSETLDAVGQGSFSTMHFVFIFDGSAPTRLIQFDNTFATQTSMKTVATQKDYNAESTGSGTGSIWEQCDPDVQSSADTFYGGTRDFRRDGARYVMTCHVTKHESFANFQDMLYDPSSLSTSDITMKVTLDSEYAQGSPTPDTTLVPLDTPTPYATLAPLDNPPPDNTLAPLVTPDDTLAPLVR